MYKSNRSSLLKIPFREKQSTNDSEKKFSPNFKQSSKFAKDNRILQNLDDESDENTNIIETDSKNIEDLCSSESINDENLTPLPLPNSSNAEKIVFNVVHGKKSTKKHKTFECDGILEILGKNVILKDLEGNILGKTSVKPETVVEGLIFSVGNREVEIIEKSSHPYTNKTEAKKLEEEPIKKDLSLTKKFVPMSSQNLFKKLVVPTSQNFKKVGVSKKNVLPSAPKLISGKKSVTEKKIDEESSSKSILQFLDMNEPSSKSPVNDSEIDSSNKIIFKVVYGKMSTKKHKTFDEDGTLEVEGKNAILKDEKGKIIGRTSIKLETVIEGFTLRMGGKEVEVLEKSTLENSAQSASSESHFAKKLSLEPPLKKMKPSNYLPLKSSGKVSHLYSEPLVMPNPGTEVSLEDENASQMSVCEVSVDACLTRVLRPYQRYGLVFLYKCVMGMNKPGCHGVILADEMGLGKTLQCVSLAWTLLKQGPYGKPEVKRVLVVAPSSLCSNWKKEFIHWLGSQRVQPFVVEGKDKPKDFAKFPRSQVMIISYEMLSRNFEDVESFGFDLVLIDEGNRMKNSQVKVLKLLAQSKCSKRVLITGTPVQNNLQELYTLSDFVNPGIFESPSFYKRYYENPIVASQKPNALEEDVALGRERADELREHTKLFILRRTNDLISKYLPQKHELVIFCRPTLAQKSLYESVVDEWFNRTEIHGAPAIAFSVITALKKICNHPNLLKEDKNEFVDNGKMREKLANFGSKNELSGKVVVVKALMRELKNTQEKLVLVSYFTQTLDLLERLCCEEGFKFCRLDGSIAASARGKIVEQFNSSGGQDYRVFLLSAKAGGVGLNLPGASRLILFDSDWNPASDAQAMARIWRQGQKRTVYLYRLLTTGTIEEKIYQRQISKISLSEAVVDSNHISSLKLSESELKDLFTLTEETDSVTHDLMNCSCENPEERMEIEKDSLKEDEETDDSQFQLNHETEKQQRLTINSLRDWEHFRAPVDSELLEDLMLESASSSVSFVFKTSTETEK